MESPTPVEPPRFLFISCQRGAEPAVKHELARDWPGFKFAYSRPGFLTFKLPDGITLPDDFVLGSVFARTHGICLGKVTGPIFKVGAAFKEGAGATLEERAAAVWQLAGDRPYRRLHVWSRDLAIPGHRHYEPNLTPGDAALGEAILAARPAGRFPELTPDTLNAPAARGDLVLDCVAVGPEEWWIGYHAARHGNSLCPGGLRAIELPEHAVSRAYLKMNGALDWAGMPIASGQHCAEIGCAPGGAAQALLERGFVVMGIDPAEIPESVSQHPRFTHIRKRGHEVRRREFRKTRWLFADVNVAPSYTLDTIEAIVTHPEVNVRGLLLTLKLLEWSLAEEIPQYLERIQSWGFSRLRAQQLQHHRQEFCVAAMRPSSKAAKTKRSQKDSNRG